jgi:histidinol-phosphatase (PHP family)
MISNYHTHTWRCNHATGTEREYIETAKRNGLKRLGFSDHTPYLFTPPYYSRFRMKPELTGDYYRTVGELREEYGRDPEAPQIFIGFEMEYYPEFFRQTLDFLAESTVKLSSGAEAGLQYLVLGQHFTNSEYNGKYSGSATDDETVLADYVESSVKAMETGLFSFFAHPDLIQYVGPERTYEKHIRQLLAAAQELDVPLEINLLGMHEGRHYPSELFWSLAAETKCRMILQNDAHEAWMVGDPGLVSRGEAFAKRLGIKLTEDIELIDPLRQGGWK